MFFKKKKKEVSKVFVNQPENTQDVIPIGNITIPQIFRMTKPRDEKLKYYQKLFKENGFLDKPLTIRVQTNEKGFPNELLLTNGYIRYLIAKMFNITEVPVIYQ